MFDVSIDTLINYLAGVAIGGVAFSVLLAIIMALPVIIDKSGKVNKLVTTKVGYIMKCKCAARSLADLYFDLYCYFHIKWKI